MTGAKRVVEPWEVISNSCKSLARVCRALDSISGALGRVGMRELSEELMVITDTITEERETIYRQVGVICANRLRASQEATALSLRAALAGAGIDLDPSGMVGSSDD